MFSIVFIDDEPWTLDDLSGIIDWSAYGFTEIQSFSDPVQAAAYIKANKPDAVCTDIRMPELSGLDLIAECRSQCPDTLFVVISAYAEFEFARRAVKEGAFSYLLKPLMENDILDLAEKMRDSISRRRESILRQAVRSVTVGILLSSGNDTQDSLNNPGLGLIRKNCDIAVSDSSLAAQLGGEWFRVYDDLFVGLIPSSGPNYPEYILCGIRTGVSVPDEIIPGIRKALLDFFTLRFYGAQSGVLETVGSDPEDWKEDRDLLLSAVRERNDALISEKLREIEEESSHRMTSIETLSLFYDSILEALLDNSQQAELKENIKRFPNPFQMYSVFRDYQVLFHSIHMLLNNIEMPDDGTASNADLAAAIVSYVDVHYTEPITLESLSDKFSVSLSQISRYFKKQTGFSYITYLTQKRVRRACQLLSRTNLPITDISSMVGYSDYFYFAKKFKNIMNETPSQYRMRQNEKAD